MKGILIDSSIILDLFEDDQNWAEWSESSLEHYGMTHTLYINAIIYAEVSIGFERIEELESAITGCGFQMIQIPKEALFLAGKAFIKYKTQKGANYTHCPIFLLVLMPL